MTFSQLSSLLSRIAIRMRDVNAVLKGVKTGNPQPVLRRLFNKVLFREVFSKILWKK
ncbi:MAG: hypothetical protein PHC35_02335 [Deltaproteobacteria bacterium]|jgi:hypothetical protein|nr:hypothetical protein [Deltaproteobacteria bacterium]